MIIKIPFGMMFIYTKIPFLLGLLFLFIYLGFQVLHIFIENYVWRKEKFPIYESIFQILYLVTAFFLSVFLFY